MRTRFSIFLAGFALAAASASAGIIVTTTNDANTLANLIGGAGVTISNAVYVGAAGASGTFTGGNSAGIGIDTGIMLTSGAAQNAVGPNDQTGAGTSNGTAGDADLNALVAPNSTLDAAVLSFDFTTDTGNLFFNFSFASEEYSEYVDSQFNDVFALFVDGVNKAFAPDAQPVAINTVNCGNPYAGPAPGAGPNCSSFNYNEGPPVFDIQYDGFTDVFTASILGLAPGTHTFKAAIADTSDSILDSAVFIQGGTFSGEPPSSVPEPSTMLLLGGGLLAVVRLRRRQTAQRDSQL